MLYREAAALESVKSRIMIQKTMPISSEFRTVVDNDGKIVRANYGKIYGDFMNFSYYLNPSPMTGTLNLIRSGICFKN